MALNDEIIKLLTEFGLKLVPDLQQSLASKLGAKSSKYGTRRSGKSRLSDSIKFSFPKKQGSVVFSLTMDEYGGAVDGGRKAAPVSRGGQEKLKKWAEVNGVAEKLRVKDLATRKANQKSKKTLKKMPFETAKKSIAFLVQRKLSKHGYEGNGFFNEIVEDGRLEELKAKLIQLIKKDITIEIVNTIK